MNTVEREEEVMRCYKKQFSWDLVEDEKLKYIRWPDCSMWYWSKETCQIPESLYFVYVCGFRFVFTSISEIAVYRAFYEQPLKPSFRLPHVYGCHSDEQSRFARLPLYLWQKAKRVKVVAALGRAIREFARG